MNRYGYCLFLVIFYFNFGAYAQTGEVDSLKISEMLEELSPKPHTEENFKQAELIEKLSKEIHYRKGEALALNRQGAHFANSGDYEAAIALHQKAAKIGEETGNKKIIAHSAHGLGNTYNAMNELEKAFEYFDKAMKIGQAMNDITIVGNALNSIGILHIKWGKPKEALDNLMESKRIFEQLNKSNKVERLLNNIAIAYVQTGRAAESIPYFKGHLKHTQNQKDTLGLASCYGNLAYAYQNMGDFENAFAHYDTSLYYSKKLEQDEVTYITYLDMSDGYSMKGDFKQALEYHQKFYALGRKVLDNQTKARIDELEVKFDTEKKEKELLTAQKEVAQLQVGRQRMWLLIGGLGAGLIIALLIFFKARGDAKRKELLRQMNAKLIQTELKNKELESEQLKIKLENKQSDLTNLALDIARKNEFSNQLIEQLEALRKTRPSEIKSKLREVISFASNHLQINEDLALLQENVDKINHEFYQSLDAQFGGLSQTEKFMAGLIRLNLSNKDIAALRNISVSSAKMGRYRLRKKLEIESDVDIVGFLQRV